VLVDSELVGDWMASSYLPDGIRIDHALSLQADTGFVWRTRHEGRGEHTSRGTWKHDHREGMLYFTPSEPGLIYGPDRPQLWRVLRIMGLEEANTFMVLRWVAVASRNLPVLFFRVHVRSAEQS
jgi:hypothetical protein